MQHSTLVFFALMNMVVGLDISSQNILLFLVFYMLHKSVTDVCFLTRGLDDLILENQFYTLVRSLEGALIVT